MSSLLAANTIDAATLADELARFRVIEPNRLSDLLSNFASGDPVALAEYLVDRGALTPFQANQALAGESRTIALGPYSLTGLAGSGAFGPVYAANRRDKTGEFRVRVLPLRSLWKARQAKQLARSLGAILHPAVIPLVDADSAKGFHYLVWPHVEGDLLAARVASSGPLLPGKVIDLLAHLADALHACHVRKIVHGALTPRSIIIDRHELPRLLELGAGAILAANLTEEESLLDTLSASFAATGILRFAAPEFIADPVGNPATDQYALGAIGYFALTGKAPFATASLIEWLTSRVSRPSYRLSELPASIPPKLMHIIDRMLQPNPADRFLGLDEVQDQLAGIAGEMGTVVESALATDTFSSESLSPVPSCDPSRSNGGISWSTRILGIANLPARDDTDASITFELPPPVPDFSPEPALLRNGRRESAILSNEVETATPSPLADRSNRGGRVTAESTRHRESLLNRCQAGPEGKQEAPSVRPAPVPVESQTVAPSPTVRKSPAQPEDLHMAKPMWPDPFEGTNGQVMPPQTRTPPDPRKGVYTPVHYHTQTADETTDSVDSSQTGELSESDDRPVTDSVLWRKVKRNLLFWQKPTDVVRVSVFGPASVAPGQPAKVTVFLHTPETTDSVRTLSRAFLHDSELIGSGYVAKEVARESTVGVHLSVANAGVTKSLMTLVWRGQPQRLVFDLHVPWESPSGPAPGLVSIGRNNIRIGKIEFRLTLLPRKV